MANAARQGERLMAGPARAAGALRVHRGRARQGPDGRGRAGQGPRAQDPRRRLAGADHPARLRKGPAHPGLRPEQHPLLPGADRRAPTRSTCACRSSRSA
ncbi:MAG: hypothetical protein MZV70_06215 [Desulfobacterales bacterium]|nr:hypothetical protein [Desulfobacterales bacterium]